MTRAVDASGATGDTGTAGEADLRRADADARLRAITTFDRPLFVEAGAGTGKTTTLVARIVTWCVGPGWRDAEQRARDRHDATGDARIAESVIGGVLAITFTDAAAAKMEDDVRVAFGELSRRTWPRGIAEHAHALGLSLDTASARAARIAVALEGRLVLTIHAWCRTLLAEHPLEAGLAPSFRVDAQGTETEEIVRETLEAAFSEALGTEPNADWLLLARRGHGPSEIEEALRAMLARGVRSTELERDPFDAERIAKHCGEIGHCAAAFAELAIPPLENVRGIEKQQAMLAAVAATCDAIPSHAVRDVAGLQALCDALRRAWDDRCRDALEDWAKGKLGKKVAAALGDGEAAVLRCAHDLERQLDLFLDLDPELTSAARRVSCALLERVERAKRARGVAAFADLLRDARDLLRDHPEIRGDVRRRTRQILVDEFQDTDPVQCDLVRSIAFPERAYSRASDSRAGVDSGASENSARGGAHVRERDEALPGLFVVGDPKQSIYAWRSADLSAYEEFQRALEANGGLSLRLSVNYRSSRAILAAVERAIEPVMRADPGFQPEFQPLVAHAKPLGLPVEHWVSWELDADAAKRCAATSAERASEIEACWLAADLEAQHAAGTAWKKLAILLRTSTALETYLGALRERSIPFEVVGDKSYFRRREIIDAVSIVKCVVDPHDRLALAAALRSSAIGVPDAALIPLWTAGFPDAMSELAPADGLERVSSSIARALAALPDDVAGLERVRGFEISLADAVEKIGCLRRSFAEEPLDVFVERLRALFAFEVLEAARPLGAWRAANLERFFRQLARAFTDDAGDPHAALRALERALREQRDAEEARPKLAAERDAVQVMTIHKAKGLDFAHVYVVALHRESKRGTCPTFDADTVDGRTELVLFGAPTLDYPAVHARRGRHESAERVRTLYVAMTRAEERLVLLGAWPESIERKEVESCRTHLELLAWSAPQSLAEKLAQEVAASTGAGAGARFELEGQHFFLPPRHEARVRAPRDAAASIDVASIERDAQRLREQAVQAAQRMARPFSTALSSDESERDAAQDAGDPLDERVPVRRSNARADARAASARASALAGSAVHRALEEFDWSADLEREVRRRRDGLATCVACLAGASERDAGDDRAAAALALDVFDRFARGALFARLAAHKQHIVARELPVVCVPGDASAAVGFESGVIDLVFTDPRTSELVVVDYKTDAVRTREEALQRSRAYAAQARAYPRALRNALGLDRDPRFELWFLQADCAIEPLAELRSSPGD